ncbi:MAG TPA: GNAT family N-acyltransferase, partial [Alphaproteobacteria bacterium]
LGPIVVRLARNEDEIRAAQKLRYDIFYTEYGAKPIGTMAAEGRDFDQFDDVADHLVVVDRKDGTDHIVGTYRLLRNEAAQKAGRFYSASEFDISDLTGSDLNLVEVGRSCVRADFRTRAVLQLLWQGIAEYVSYHNIQVLFGCASFHGTNLQDHANELSFLHHYSHAPEGLCPKALPDLYKKMDLMPKDQVNTKKALAAMPPLIKGYLRLGGFVGDGAIIDEQFNTIDVAIVVKVGLVSDRYRKHYERKVDTTYEVDDVNSKSEII